MPKHILIVGNITEAIEIHNSASVGKKDTSSLEKDNFLYIDILDYWTNLIKIFFKIPGMDNDIKGVDLIYESPHEKTKKLIDIKTQANIGNVLNLYIREFSDEKIRNRNYIIFNKKDKKIFGKIFFVSAVLIDELFENKIFIQFLEDLKIFENLTQKYIEADKNLAGKFSQLRQDFHNKVILIGETQTKLIFLPARKDKHGVIGNTNFKENIKLEISC